MAKRAARFWPESATKASTVHQHMLAEAHLQRDQKHSLPRQNLQQAVECDMKDGLQFSASRASMPRNAHFHKTAEALNYVHRICAMGRRTKPFSSRVSRCKQFHEATGQAVAVALGHLPDVKLSASLGGKTSLHVLPAAKFMGSLVPGT